MAVVSVDGRQLQSSFSCEVQTKQNFQEFDRKYEIAFEELKKSWVEEHSDFSVTIDSEVEKGNFPFTYQELDFDSIGSTFPLDMAVSQHLYNALTESTRREPKMGIGMFIRGLCFLAHVNPEESVSVYEYAMTFPWFQSAVKNYPYLKNNIDNIMQKTKEQLEARQTDLTEIEKSNFSSLTIADNSGCSGASMPFQSLAVGGASWPIMSDKCADYLDSVMTCYTYREDPNKKNKDGSKCPKIKLFEERLNTRTKLKTVIMNVKTQAKSASNASNMQKLHHICSVLIRDIPESEGYKNPTTKDDGSARSINDSAYYSEQKDIKKDVMEYFTELKYCLERRAIAIGVKLSLTPLPSY
ncbi:hypothetical protein D5R81_19005 [Parashewanella spongiae]|uniref:Uncharacterized protein n=1 Tax=Parashewanella spongiae TaxID=342950 RepID=A0A3A6T9L4_9GAMM|nr:hypothetical protein [Parashewanella spongiae]MCL1080114.1 hypothetical protein [Parashewanella spongiae]RJY04919.1 hypothetical protein D5R81_19005 [Parashewanella spongiae]